MATPHDKLFKTTFSQVEHARSELASVLPASVSAMVRWDTLTLVSGEFVDAQLAHLQSDLLFTARIGSTDACVYVLFEHQSTVDRAMPLRLLRYMTRIWERFEQDHAGKPLPVIIPVVLHHSETGWTAATRFRDLFDLEALTHAAVAPYLPDFSFVLDDLTKLDDQALRERALTEIARLTLVVMQRCRGALDPVAVLRPWLRTIVTVLEAPRGVDALSSVASYVLEASEGRPDELKVFFAQLGPRAEEAFVTAAEKLTQQVRAKALLEGEAAILVRQLTRRFGPLTLDVRRKVADGTETELERWADQVLTAATLDDVFR